MPEPMPDDARQLAALFAAPVALLGYGRSGEASARVLSDAGVPLVVWDDRAARRDAAVRGGFEVRDLADADLSAFSCLVVSPGIPIAPPHGHPIARRAAAAGLDMVCDVELLCRWRPAARIVAVTGTNGKSTTTALIAHLIAAHGGSVACGGNIGTPALTLPALGAAGIYVLELSSYQLDLLARAHFEVAVLLNISPDHLAHHGGLDAYVAAKRKIFDRQEARDTAILGIDTPWTAAVYDRLAGAGRQTVVAVSGRADGGAQRADIGIADGWLVDHRTAPATRLADLSAAPALPGPHNAENAAAAVAAVTALGLAHGDLTASFASFPGLPHRQELVATIERTRFVNDSKATNLDAAARALACYDDIYWIAGGQPKAGNDDFAAVARHAGRIRHAFLIGEAVPRFERALAGTIKLSLCERLPVAVRDAARQAAAHAAADQSAAPVVLLSPGCASFDQFADFEARGQAFRDAVASLQNKPSHRPRAAAARP